jgi:hypothetical protein
MPTRPVLVVGWSCSAVSRKSSQTTPLLLEHEPGPPTSRLRNGVASLRSLPDPMEDPLMLSPRALCCGVDGIEFGSCGNDEVDVRGDGDGPTSGRWAAECGVAPVLVVVGGSTFMVVLRVYRAEEPESLRMSRSATTWTRSRSAWRAVERGGRVQASAGCAEDRRRVPALRAGANAEVRAEGGDTEAQLQVRSCPGHRRGPVESRGVAGSRCVTRVSEQASM